MAGKSSSQVGIVATGTFWVVKLIREILGWVMGAPGTDQRAMMVSVLTCGNLSADLEGGRYAEASIGGVVLVEHIHVDTNLNISSLCVDNLH